MAFYGGLADVMATVLRPDDGSAIAIAVGLDSWHPTEGTRKTGDRNVFTRTTVEGGRMVPLPEPAPSRSWDFPEPFGEIPVVCVPLSETVLLARHVRADSILNFINLKPLQELGDEATPAPVAVDERGRSAQRFVVDVRVDGRRALARGQDIYAVTAPLAVHAALAAIRRQTRGGPGVRAPGEALDVHALVDALAPDIAIKLDAA